MKNLLFTLFLLLGLVSKAQYQEKDILEPLPQNKHKFVLVDVRTPEEFNAGHIPGAENIDWFSPEFNAAFKDFKKRQKIYVYCRSGKRSAKAAARLDSLGFKRVVNLLGGYKAFKELE